MVPIVLVHRTVMIADVSEKLIPIEIFPNVHFIGINYMKRLEEGAKKRRVTLPNETTVIMKPTTVICGPFKLFTKNSSLSPK